MHNKKAVEETDLPLYWKIKKDFREDKMDGDQITGGSILRPNFISHGTLGCKNLEKTRQFYEAFLGLECVRTSQNSMMIRLGGQHIYAVVQVGEEKDVMPRHYHNGLDVATDEEVDAAYKTVLDNSDEWGIHSVNRLPNSWDLLLQVLGFRRQLLGDP